MRKVQTTRRALAAGAASLGVVLALGILAPMAGASTTHQVTHRAHHYGTANLTGTITATATGSFTLLRGSKSYTIDELASTRVREAGVPGLTVADLAVGNRVNVVGQRTATAGTIDGIVVTIVREPRFSFDGTVSAIGTGSFSLLRSGRTWTVDVSASTVYTVPGVTSPTLANLAVGEDVATVVTKTTIAGTLDALHVTVKPLSYVHFVGAVTGLSATGFTVVHAGVTRTVDVTPSTVFAEPGLTGITFTNLAVGDEVDVIASSTSTAGTVDALAVVF